MVDLLVTKRQCTVLVQLCCWQQSQSKYSSHIIKQLTLQRLAVAVESCTQPAKILFAGSPLYTSLAGVRPSAEKL